MIEYSILDNYLELNSEKAEPKFKIEIRKFLNKKNGNITLKEVSLSNALSANKSGVTDNICQYIVDVWKRNPKPYKKWIVEVLKKNCPHEIDNSQRITVSFLLLAWANDLIKDDILDELAKYQIRHQITAHKPEDINLIQLEEREQIRPAHRPRLPDELLIDVLMVYFETGFISKTAKILGKSNKTIRSKLKIIIGNEYAQIPEETHPEYGKILIAHEIWKSKKK